MGRKGLRLESKWGFKCIVGKWKWAERSEMESSTVNGKIESGTKWRR